MSKFIGLRSGFADRMPTLVGGLPYQDKSSTLKQQALLFDQIGITKTNLTERASDAQQWNDDLFWLQENGLVFPIPYPPKKDQINNTQIAHLFDLLETKKISFFALLDTLIDATNNDAPDNPKTITQAVGENRTLPQTVGEHIFQAEAIALRILALQMELTNEVTAIPLLPYLGFSYDFPTTSKQDAIEIVIKKLPIPSEVTPWEAIIDYRNDPETQKSLRALRSWTRKLSSENISPIEINDELETLIDEYQNHMKLHRLKSNTETLEIISKIPFELLENLLKIKFSKIPEPFFAIKKRQIALMEAEINAPGREIAYILKTNEKFPNI